MPTSVEEFTCKGLPDSGRQLVIELLHLVRLKHDSITDLIRHAMCADPHPSWAAGDPTNQKHLVKAKSAVSKFLGRAALQAPDWPTIQWIVATCAGAGPHDVLLSRLAALWCDTTGASSPPGYLGTLNRGDSQEPQLVELKPAADDAGRAEFYRQRLAVVEEELAGKQAEVVELGQKLLLLAKTLGYVGKDLSHQKDKEARTHEVWLRRVHAERRNRDAAVEQVRRNLSSKLSEANKRLFALYHFVAALVAHQTSRWSPQALSLPTLVEAVSELDSPLSDLALQALHAPPMPEASQQTRWITAYLRTVVLLAPLEHAWGIDDPDGEVVALVDHGQLPSPAMLQRLVHRHPVLSSRNLRLMSYAYPDTGRSPVVAATPAPAAHRASQPPVYLFEPALLAGPKPATSPLRDTQITVAELIVRITTDAKTWPDPTANARGSQQATTQPEPCNGTA